MTETVLEEVTEALRGPIEVVAERRGFAKRRGVPDSVFWLSPADERFPDHLLPVLIELEGSFTGATTDFEKFAARYGDPDYQYHLDFPVIGLESPDPIRRSLTYDIIGIRANSLTDFNSIEEQQMHDEYQVWFERFLPAFETDAIIQSFLSPTVVIWSVKFTMFSHQYETIIPFIIDNNDGYSGEFLNRLSTPTVPCVVVINEKYDPHEHTTLHYRTAIEFPTRHPIRFDTPHRRVD